MVNRFGTWGSLWLALMLVWTVVAAASAWLNLPRANSIALDTNELAQMAAAAAAILPGNDTVAEVAGKARREPLVWSPVARIVRLMNGVEMSLPGNTTGEQAARVATEYRQILHARAVAQRWQFLPGMLLLWLLPCAGVAIAVGAYQHAHRNGGGKSAQKMISYVRQRTVAVREPGDNALNGGAAAIKVPVRSPRREIEWACAV